MSKLFKGKADGLNYFETEDQAFRSVYKTDIMSGLELPGQLVCVDIIRVYKWSGTDWKPAEVSGNQRTRWSTEIAGLLEGGDS